MSHAVAPPDQGARHALAAAQRKPRARATPSRAVPEESAASDAESAITRRLRAAGLRPTLARVSVLELLAQTPDPLRANGIYRRLIERGDLPHTNVSVIYRALRQMCDAALLLSHRSAGRAMCYSLAPQNTQNPVLRVTTSHSNGSGGSSVTISDPRLCAQILAAIAQKGLQVGDAKLSLHIRLARQRRGAQNKSARR